MRRERQRGAALLRPYRQQEQWRGWQREATRGAALLRPYRQREQGRRREAIRSTPQCLNVSVRVQP
jgi:hypothetical protein